MILGIDEVGRGPWAGPLVVGACVLHDNPREVWQAQLTDSKRLTAKQREALEPVILSEAAAIGLGWVSAEELDAIGLSKALRLACRRAVLEVKKKKVPFSEIVIDGTINFLAQTSLGNFVTTLKKADLLVKEVSAASIVAKVARDRYMKQLAKQYPNYGFEKHVGYGTKFHRKALERLGPCAEHRKSFKPIKELSRETNNHTNTTDIGKMAEETVAKWLAAHGHQIIAQNYKTPYYEIDLISTKAEHIYFTEVKYRRDARHGAPLEMITPQKRQQMTFAAESFLHTQKTSLQPKLAVAAVSGDNYSMEKWFSLEAK